MKKQTLTNEQKKWLKVLKLLRAAYRTVPTTPDGNGFKEVLSGFFDECDWEERLPSRFLRQR